MCNFTFYKKQNAAEHLIWNLHAVNNMYAAYVYCPKQEPWMC